MIADMTTLNKWNQRNNSVNNAGAEQMQLLLLRFFGCRMTLSGTAM